MHTSNPRSMNHFLHTFANHAGNPSKSQVLATCTESNSSGSLQQEHLSGRNGKHISFSGVWLIINFHFDAMSLGTTHSRLRSSFRAFFVGVAKRPCSLPCTKTLCGSLETYRHVPTNPGGEMLPEDWSSRFTKHTFLSQAKSYYIFKPGINLLLLTPRARCWSFPWRFFGPRKPQGKPRFFGNHHWIWGVVSRRWLGEFTSWKIIYSLCMSPAGENCMSHLLKGRRRW